jgi:hypothetical protein
MPYTEDEITTDPDLRAFGFGPVAPPPLPNAPIAHEAVTPVVPQRFSSIPDAHDLQDVAHEYAARGRKLNAEFSRALAAPPKPRRASPFRNVAIYCAATGLSWSTVVAKQVTASYWHLGGAAGVLYILPVFLGLTISAALAGYLYGSRT